MVTYYRRLPKFEYLVPKSVSETLTILTDHKGSSKIIAGGTDLIPKLKHRDITLPKYIVDIKGITALNFVKLQGEDLRIGALAPIADVENLPAVKDKFNILWQAVSSMASVQIRNRGTIAGNICNAVPSADSVPALLALGAKLKLTGRGSSRVITLDGFITGPNKTVIREDEVLEEIVVPAMPFGSKGVYLKLTQRHVMDLAIVGVAVLITVDRGACRDVKIALGAVSPTPIRAPRAESVLKGKTLSPELIDNAARLAADECKPITDHRASAEYRKDMVAVLTKRAIAQIAGF
jgi:CO/xanthine dehydrogenase FAD-binding subunit